MTPPVTSEELEQIARECITLAAVDPSTAKERALQVQNRARRIKEWRAVCIARRAAGLAAKQLDDLPGSAAYLRQAVRAAKLSGSERLLAEARASLAGTLVLQGRTTSALAEVSAAVAVLHGIDGAKAQIDRAAVLQLAGRKEEALAAIRLALPVLRRAKAHDWTARALSNRSLLHISARSFRAAEEDLHAAQLLCEEHQLAMWAAYVAQNLGWLASSRGDVVAALEHYEQAEHMYGALGADVGSLHEARARLLLSVRLVDEARDAAEAAVDLHSGQQRLLEIVDAQLLLSTVALVQGDGATAVDAAEKAVRGYRRLDQRNGFPLARYALLQARYANDPKSVTSALARECADQLAAVGWLVPSLEARILAGRLSLIRGQRVAARRDLYLAAAARFTGPADVRVRAWLAEALLHRAEGRRTSAKRAVSNGLRVLERYQNTLGATELRAHVSVYRGAIATVGLQMAMQDGHARRVLSFVERGRASALLTRRAQPPDDAQLSRALSDLRMTMTEIESRRLAGRPTAGLVQRQVKIEREVADRCRRFPAATGTTQSMGRRIDELIAGLGSAALVEYIELDEQLHAVTVVDGVARLHSLGARNVLKPWLAHLTFAMRRLVNPSSTRTSQTAALANLARVGRDFDELLFGPFRRRLGDRPIVVVPSISLQSLPWSVLPTAISRPVSVVPSARLWLGASELAKPGDEAGIVVVAGPGLPGARSEAEAVARQYSERTLLVDDAATVDAVGKALDGAALAHIASHGVLRSDNPSFSSLVLADGPLTVYELERLHRAPHHVVLAACEAATPKVVAIDEVLGLAAALLAQGTSCVIAPVISVVDESIVDFMVGYHAELRAGLDPASALAAAQAKAAAQDPATWAAAAGFICMGAGQRR